MLRLAVFQVVTGQLSVDADFNCANPPPPERRNNGPNEQANDYQAHPPPNQRMHMGNGEYPIPICSICHRASTQSYQLRLVRLPARHANLRIVRRVYGDHNGMIPEAIVCSLCYHYVVAPVGVNVQVRWKQSWPATLWSILVTDGMFPPVVFMQFFARTMRQSWEHSLQEWCHAMRAAFQTPPTFRDVTVAKSRCDEDRQTCTLGSIMDLANRECFPTVRCCLGCAFRVDVIGTDEVALIPAHHYLAYINQNFRSFAADRNKFIGCRSDWTQPFRDLNWTVSPSLYYDEDMGLSIPMCSRKIHANASFRYIHPATHPLLTHTSPQKPDYLAPAVVSTRVVKQARTNAMTASYPVLSQAGNSGGLSTFHISSRRPDVDMDDLYAKVNGLTLRNRTDIQYFANNCDSFNPDMVERCVVDFDAARLPHETLVRHASSGTYVEVSDACQIAHAYNSKLTAHGDDNPHVAEVGIDPGDCLLFFHPHDDFGHPPFSIPMARNPLLSCPSYCVLVALLHCRELHRQFLSHLWSPQPLPRQREVAKFLQTIVSGRTASPVVLRRLEEILIGYAERNGHQHALHRTISNIIRTVCPPGVVIIVENDQGMPPDDDEQSVLCIVSRFDNRDELAPLPWSFQNGAWVLMLALRFRRRVHEVQFSFRWRDDLQWQTGGPADAPPPADVGSQPFLLYVRTDRGYNIAREDILHSCGGQAKVYCVLHDMPLIGVRYTRDVPCNVIYCTNMIRWRCIEGRCLTGLCRKHLRQNYNNDRDLRSYVGHYGPAMLHPPPFLQAEALTDSDGSDEEPEVIVALDGDDEREGIPRNDPIVDDLPAELLPTHFADDFNYTFQPDDDSFLGHHLLNHSHLNVLTRHTRTSRAPVAAQTVLQNICTKVPSWTLPLITPEAQLFTVPLWAMNGINVIGAMPSILYTPCQLTQLRIASLSDHILIRVRNPALLMSRDISYVQFLFDLSLNSDLNKQAASIVTRRGLEHLTRGRHVQQLDSAEHVLPMEESDSMQQVRRLSAIQRQDGSWNLFITLTCNDSATMGVWPIRKAIETHFGPLQIDNALQSYSGLITSAWYRSSKLMWHYLVHSPEHPLGASVKTSWYRYEFQSSDALGNKPHVHGGVVLEDHEVMDVVKNIACSMKTMFTECHLTDQESLIRRGIITNNAEYVQLVRLASILQFHDCDSPKSRCKKNGCCRVQQHPPSFRPKFVPKENMYSPHTCQFLQRMGLAEVDQASGQWVIHPDLQGGRWEYPAEPTEHFVPTNPQIFVAMRSSTNIQYCDKRFNHAYLAKYAAGLEERPAVDVQADQNNDIRVSVQPQQNLKISGQNLQAPKGGLYRCLAFSEALWFVHGFDYVVHDRDITHVCTLPPEYRPGHVKRQRRNAHDPGEGGGGDPEPVRLRIALPAWRQFTHSQALEISGYERGNYKMDNTRSFSVRPPELLCVDKLEDYLRFFSFHTSGGRYEVHNDLARTPWMDGARRFVRIRSAHFLDVVSLFQRLSGEDDNPHLPSLAHIRNTIIAPLHQEWLLAPQQGSVFFLRFVDIEARRKNVVVFSQIAPDNTDRFFVHMLLTMGRFRNAVVTELDLYGMPSLLEAFIALHLLPENPTMDHIHQLGGRYVMEHLQFMSIGVRRMERLIAALIDNLSSLIRPQALPNMPAVSEEDMRMNATAELEELVHGRLSGLAHVLRTENIADFPPVDELVRGQLINYVPRVHRLPGQSDESVDEQTRALATCVGAVNDVVRQVSTRCLILIGPPGAGKTYLALTCVTYALTRQLTCQVTAFTSERARRLAGEHLHLLFDIKGSTFRNLDVRWLSEESIRALQRHPIKMAFLQRIDVLFIDEIGLISAEMLGVIDRILRFVRGNSRAFGGVFILATGDPHQLAPIEGSPLWTSSHMFLSFTCVHLRYYVRAAEDDDLQRLITILRQAVCTDDDMDEFIEIVQRRVLMRPGGSVASWRLVPEHYLKIVGTRQACNTIVQQYLEEKINDARFVIYRYHAQDSAEIAGGRNVAAVPAEERFLSYHLQELGELILFVGSVVRLTYNNTEARPNLPRFSQGQLAVVTALPDPVLDTGKLHLRIIPLNERFFDIQRIPAHWPHVSLPRRRTVPMFFKHGRRLHRFQFPVAYYISLTAHRAIGQTCPFIATQISCRQREFRLWQKEQALVILSRPRTLNGVIFVTHDHADLIQALRELLQQSNPLITHAVRVLEALQPLIVQPRIIPHMPHSQLPVEPTGVVYMLVSTRFPRYAYVGETNNITRRLGEHNRGQGARLTADAHLRPWRVYVLICNFPGLADSHENIRARKSFEAEWHRRINALPHRADTRAIHIVGSELFQERALQVPFLLWTEFCQIRYA